MPPTFRFGDNTLSPTAEDQFTINFVHGGQWMFDTAEIEQLDAIASDFQTEPLAVIRDLWRTNGGSVHFEDWLQHIFLYENYRDAYFLGYELAQLREAIRLSLAELEG